VTAYELFARRGVREVGINELVDRTQTRPSSDQPGRSRPGTLGGGGQPPPVRPPRVGPAARDQGGTHQVCYS
jgi:hypothetical protein